MKLDFGFRASQGIKNQRKSPGLAQVKKSAGDTLYEVNLSLHKLEFQCSAHMIYGGNYR